MDGLVAKGSDYAVPTIRNLLEIFIACSLLVFPITAFLKIGIWKIAISHGFIFFLHCLSCFSIAFHFRRMNRSRYQKQHNQYQNTKPYAFFLICFSYPFFCPSVHSSSLCSVPFLLYIPCSYILYGIPSAAVKISDHSDINVLLERSPQLFPIQKDNKKHRHTDSVHYHFMQLVAILKAL